MREFFELLRQQGESGINRLIDSHRQESVDLEFTGKARPQEAGLDRSDLEKLATVISAFANSAGGVLIWGVDARKNADGIDCASAALPIEHIERFETDIVEAATIAVMPRHAGVHVASIKRDDGTGSGYLVVHVERSERRPHRCEVSSRVYYKRIGSKSMQMEHYDIEDAFKRTSVAELEMSAVAKFGGRTNSDGKDIVITNVDLILRNISPLSARFPYVKFETSREGLIDYIGGADQVIHPGNSIVAAYIRISTPRMTPVPKLWFDDEEISIASTSIACNFGCFNSVRRWAGFRIFGNRQVEVLPTPAIIE